MGLDLATPAALEPVTRSEAKTHLRVDITDDDGYIDNLITAVRTAMERSGGVAYITQTWDWYLDDFPATEFELPIWPVQSVTSIKYTDEDDVEATYDSSNYRVDTVSEPARVTLKTGSTWPGVTLKESNAVVIRFVAGYGDNMTDVPEPIRQAILINVADMYENRVDAIIGTIASRLSIEKTLRMNYRSFRF